MKSILEFNTYKLVVADSVERPGTSAYQVIHKEHGVIEVETFVLPQALEYLETLESKIDADNDMKAEEEAAEVKAFQQTDIEYNH